MPRRPRDTWRKIVYAAENDFEAAVGPGRRFPDYSEAQAWVYTIQSVDELLKHLPPISVRPSHGNARASWAIYQDNAIVIVESQLTEQTILHELAHLATPSELPFHGREFIWNYLDLTLRWRGASSYIELRNQIRNRSLI